jgi:hypothetical protein
LSSDFSGKKGIELIFKDSSRGATIQMKHSAKIVFINKEDLDGVAMRFIYEKLLSHSDEEIGIVLRELFNSNNS